MLFLIPFLTALIVAAIYPLCFWISFKDPLRNDFHKFHVGLPNFVGGVAVITLLFMEIPLYVKIAALIWKAALLSISNYFWKKGRVDHRMITLPCILGMSVILLVLNELVVKPLLVSGQFNSSIIAFWGATLLGGFVLCSALFAMNLGHWYLNVHGLPVSHLMRSVKVFGFFLVLRIIWDIAFILTGKVISQGESISILGFLQHLDGFFIWIAFFFGSLFPLISLYFVRGTLLVKSTQSATGILYVVLISVLIGDLTYKYYLIKFGLAL